MALLYRANINFMQFSNNSHYRITSPIFKQLFHKGSLLQCSIRNKTTKNGISNNSNKLVKNEGITQENNPAMHISFKEILNKRREQAHKSIIVQVKSADSHEDLYHYCTRFGIVLSMHHYEVSNHKHFILVEFARSITVQHLMSQATFMEPTSIIPVKSPMFWFRLDSSKPKKLKSQSLGLSVRNGTQMPAEQGLINSLMKADSVSDQMVSLYNMLRLNDLGIRLRFQAAHQLEQSLSGLFPNAVIHPFGSSINGFGKGDCDLDSVLILDSAEVRTKNIGRLIFHAKTVKTDEKLQIKELMETVAMSMQHLIPGIYNVRRIFGARVPIIKFSHAFTKLECDLSLSNTCAIHMSELLYLYGEMDSRVRPLVFTVRKWASDQNLTKSSPGPWVTNFSLTLLVIFYLQNKCILPSLDVLRSLAEQSDKQVTPNAVDCTFLRNIQKIPSKFRPSRVSDSLQDLLYGFFEFYAKFDYETRAISIREGIDVNKKDRSPLYICNPLETHLNVSKNVSYEELQRIKSTMKNTCWYLEDSLSDTKVQMWGILSFFHQAVHSKMENMNFKTQLNLNSIFNENDTDMRTSNQQSVEAPPTEATKNEIKQR